MNCGSCGATLNEGVRFCHKCGAPVGAPAAGGWRAGLPWALGGAGLGALLTVLILRGGVRRDAASATGPVDGAEPAVTGQPPDISNMTPLERATRLYNRIMSLHAAGKADSAEFFLPMALQAYAMLPTRDPDTYYHIGVLELTAGQLAAAAALADSITRLSPTHLFGFMLRARSLELQHNVAGAKRAYQDFLSHETAERAQQRPEYQEHAQAIDAFHAAALQATAK